MLGSLPDAEDAVQETLHRAWRYRDSVKEGALLRPWLHRVATNACLDAIARDERRAVLAARAAADDDWAGQKEHVVGSERFGRLRCVVTHANLQPAVAAYVCRPGDSTWRATALDVLRIEDGLITEIVVCPPDSFPGFRLPMMMDAPEMNKCH
jgi:hypothetical protein